MAYKKNITYRTASMLLAASLLVGIPSTRSEAAVVTSNATDKIAVAFHAGTAYSAGDYVVYDGELYICTDEVQGEWDAVKSQFMQVTKNHEVGESGELGASYSESKDPSEESSLMAFVANAWQKLKTFLGIGEKGAQPENEREFKDASVSGKLNYLEQQNSRLDSSLSSLQGDVQKSFQFVSSGKGKLADTITGEGGKAGSSDSFEQFSKAIIALSKSKYQTGSAAGKEQGLTEGHEQGLAEGREQGLTEGRQQGLTEGREQGLTEGRQQGLTEGREQGLTEGKQQGIAEGKQQGIAEGKQQGIAEGRQQGLAEGIAQGKAEGIAEADGRVNPESASYKKGLQDGGIKTFDVKIKLNYDGPDCENDYFHYGPGMSENHRNWSYSRSFPGHTIIGVYAQESTYSSSGGARTKHIIYYAQDQYLRATDTNSGGYGKPAAVVNNDTVEWNEFSYNVLYKNSTYTDLTLIVSYI